MNSKLIVLVLPIMTGCIQGSGEIREESRAWAPVRAIDVRGSEDIDLSHGAGSIRVTTDDNLLRYVSTRIEGDTLIIEETTSIWPTDGIRVDVVLPTDPAELSLSGSGSLKWSGPTPLDSDGVALDISGSGSLGLSLTATTVDVSVSGSGSARLDGRAKQATVVVSGSGGVDAFDLDVESAEATVSGSGSIQLSVAAQLEANVSGSGSIVYRGTPTVDSRSSGSGSVEAAR
jgi:hypothetical protein